MLNKFIAAAAIAAAGFATQASAQACGGIYTVKPGDSLSQIADAQYKDAKRWGAIYNSNVSVIGSSPNNIRVGDKYSLPCINGLPTGLTKVENVELTSAPVEVAPERAIRTSGPLAGVNLLTAGDYAPFTDENLPNGGLITEIVQEAMGAVQPKDNFKIHFVNDWAAHLDPLLSNAMPATAANCSAAFIPEGSRLSGACRCCI